ncbi:MAG: hypothetical protein L0332_29275, partial [Chloroflexi bacterium]|nr:hypothetical protein [Chloroflexota bacterium]
FNHRIQKFDSDGNYLAQWGSLGTGNGEFDAPSGVAVDAAGNIYVAEQYNHRVQKFDSGGNYLTQWGSPGSEDGQFNYPWGLALDAPGNVYVADTFNYRIQKFDSGGNYLAQWGRVGRDNGQFVLPQDVTIDAAGQAYIVDTFNHRIQKFSLGVFNLDDAIPDDGDPITSTWVFTNLVPGSYTFTETLPAAGWVLADIVCTGGSVVMTNLPNHSVTINLVDGESVICTFHNRRPALYLPIIMR